MISWWLVPNFRGSCGPVNVLHTIKAELLVKITDLIKQFVSEEHYCAVWFLSNCSNSTAANISGFTISFSAIHANLVITKVVVAGSYRCISIKSVPPWPKDLYIIVKEETEPKSA